MERISVGKYTKNIKCLMKHQISNWTHLLLYFLRINQQKHSFLTSLSSQFYSVAFVNPVITKFWFLKRFCRQNLVGFFSDTTILVGKHHSVFPVIHEKFPHVVSVRCSCHLAHLAMSRPCLKLQRHAKHLLRNIGSYFNRSSLCRQKSQEFQQFLRVDTHKILSPVTIIIWQKLTIYRKVQNKISTAYTQ